MAWAYYEGMSETVLLMQQWLAQPEKIEGFWVSKWRHLSFNDNIRPQFYNSGFSPRNTMYHSSQLDSILLYLHL